MSTETETNHTPTPWTTEGEGPHIVARSPDGSCVLNDSDSVAICHGPDAYANKARIVACVNAFRAVPDPERFMALVADECSDHCEGDGGTCHCELCLIMRNRRAFGG